MCAAQVCLPHHTWVPGSALVLQGLGALAGFVCPITLGYLGPPSVLQGLGALPGFAAPLSVSGTCCLYGATVHELLTG